MRTIILASLLSLAAFGQDKITITVQRGTVTRTAIIDTAAATESMKALDFYAASQLPRTLNETQALHELLVSVLVGQLRITPGTAIKAANDAEATARANREKVEADFSKAAGAPPQ